MLVLLKMVLNMSICCIMLTIQALLSLNKNVSDTDVCDFADIQDAAQLFCHPVYKLWTLFHNLINFIHNDSTYTTFILQIYCQSVLYYKLLYIFEGIGGYQITTKIYPNNKYEDIVMHQIESLEKLNVTTTIVCSRGICPSRIPSPTLSTTPLP